LEPLDIEVDPTCIEEAAPGHEPRMVWLEELITSELAQVPDDRPESVSTPGKVIPVEPVATCITGVPFLFSSVMSCEEPSPWAVKLRVASLETESLNLAGLTTTSEQPSNTQSESGTLVHRRWRDARIAECEDDVLPIQVRRENDQGTPIDEAVAFGLAVTVEMPGEGRIYDQVRAGIAVQPRQIIRV
jgi:hypothetical protein